MSSNKAANTEILPEDERRAPWRRPRRVAIAGLAIVAVVQALAFAYVRAHTNGQSPLVTRGDDLSDLSLRDSNGALQELGEGQPALLLVFDADCAHSRRVAPFWTNWLESNVHKGHRVIAISTRSCGDGIRARATMARRRRISRAHRPRHYETDAVGFRDRQAGSGRRRRSRAESSRGRPGFAVSRRRIAPYSPLLVGPVSRPSGLLGHAGDRGARAAPARRRGPSGGVTSLACPLPATSVPALQTC